MREMVESMTEMLAKRYGRTGYAVESANGLRVVIGGRWLVTVSETADGSMKMVWPYGDGTVRAEVVTERDEREMQIDMTVEAGWYS